MQPSAPISQDLWRATPDEFVEVRNRVAKKLKTEGKTAEADAVKGLKKPSLALWAVNQLAVTKPTVVEDLVALGAQLEAATADALKGEGPGAMRELDRQRRHAVGDAADAAVALAETAGHPLSAGMVARVTSTLDNASLAASSRELLGAGRLPAELDSPGFEGLEGLAVELLPGRERVEVDQAEREQERAAEERRRAEAEADRLEAVAADAEEVARTARARADAARRHAQELGDGS
jgi:hypothetical protein